MTCNRPESGPRGVWDSRTRIARKVRFPSRAGRGTGQMRGARDDELLVHPVGVVVGEVADQLVATGGQGHSGPTDGAARDAVASPAAATAGGLAQASGFDIHRQLHEPASADDLVARFAARLWNHEWPGERRPDVFYDPRSVADDAPGAVLHAKAIVADDRAAFVTSANLTEAAFDRNIEVGVLTRDAALAAALARHFQVLIDRRLLVPLPNP